MTDTCTVGHLPQCLRPREPVIVTARSEAGLTNVGLRVADPDGVELPINSGEHKKIEGVHNWIWVTDEVSRIGRYTYTFTSDTCSAGGTFETERGAPRCQYERTYVLLPQSAGKAWAFAVLDACWKGHRYTIGQSADDAGIGFLDARKVIAINPGQIGTGLDAAWYEQHYPGVEYEEVFADTPEQLREILSQPVPVETFPLRGIHGPPVTFAPPQQDRKFWLDEMKAMGIAWYKDMSGDPAWLAALIERGITPVVRLYQGEKYPGRLNRDLMSKAQMLIGVSVKYFETDNEPNLPGEWKSVWRDKITWQDRRWPEMVADAWYLDAMEIVEMGGIPLFPAMAPTERNGVHPRFSSVNWARITIARLAEKYKANIQPLLLSKQIGIAVHASPFLRPFDFDPYNSDRPDDMCLRGYEIVRDSFQRHFGVDDLLILSTEGGCYEPSHLRDMQWLPPYSEEEWATKTVEMFAWLDKNSDISGMMPWILTDQGVGSEQPWIGNGWYRGKIPRQIVTKMKVK